MSISEFSCFWPSNVTFVKSQRITQYFLDIPLFLEFCHNCMHCWEMAEGSVGVFIWSPVNLSLAKQPWGCHYPCGYHPFNSSRFHLFPLHLFDAEIIWETVYGFFPSGIEANVTLCHLKQISLSLLLSARGNPLLFGI